MQIELCASKDELGIKAAAFGAAAIRRALRDRGEAAIIVATGASQFEVLAHLVQAADIDWSRVTAFHLDEYVGLPMTHPASFRSYLKQRFVDQLPQPLRAFHYIDGEQDSEAECRRLDALIAGLTIDMAFVGVGENGHLAFNDPPADFKTEKPYLVVTLDEACRQQQVGEGWFKSMAEVPTQAISMSVRQIMKATSIACSVPDQRKAEPVQAMVEGPVTPDVPASILQQHSDTLLYLDKSSASLLKQTK